MLAEHETTIRWDEAERVFWLTTTSHRTLRAWDRAGLPYRVGGMSRDGIPRRWEARIPITRRFPWRSLLPMRPATPAQVESAMRNLRSGRG